MDRPVQRGTAARVIVCGDDRLTDQVVAQLVLTGAEAITLVRSSGPPGSSSTARTVVASRWDADAFTSAGVADADVVILLGRNDFGNLNAALVARELNPALRLVLRAFDTDLGARVHQMLPDCAVVSDAAVAAPAFVSAALGEATPSLHVVGGRTLFVAPRADVPARSVVCALTRTTPEDRSVRVLPDDENAADMVLAWAPAPPVPSPGANLAALSVFRRRWWFWRHSWAESRIGPRLVGWSRRYRPSGRLVRKTLGALVLIGVPLAVVALLGALALALVTPGLSAADALYSAVLTVAGGASADVHLSAGQKIVQSVLSLIGFAFIPLVIGVTLEPVAREILDAVRRQPAPAHPVVVIGLGTLGTRITEALLNMGVPVVAVDESASARGVGVARDRGARVICGDVRHDGTLREALDGGVRAVVVTTGDEAVNVEVALRARAVQPDVRTVAEVVDVDLASRAQRALGTTTSRSVEYLAAPVFAAAARRREPVRVIPVGRRVLMIGDVQVAEGSRTAGRPVGEVDTEGELRVIAVAAPGASDWRWSPAPSHLLEPGTRAMVVATRRGLAGLLAQAGSAG